VTTTDVDSVVVFVDFYVAFGCVVSVFDF